MQKEFWNNRYGAKDYAYGKTANDFLKKQKFAPGSRVLCLAEGEGRNAIYLAEQGLQVSMIDYSSEGIKKAQQLAKEKGVEINALCLDLSAYQIEANTWDAIVIIFGHFPSELRQHIHSQVFKALKAGGQLILEAYSKDQLQHKTGGPENLSLLYSESELRLDFKDFSSLSINQLTREVIEGQYHTGKASVIQVKGKK